MKKLADVAVYSPEGEIQLVVEVKNNRNITDEWAEQLRRNLVLHSAVLSSKYFLLALPDHFYLWRDNVSPTSVHADYKVSSKEVLSLYIDDDIDLGEISEQGLELLVRSWLGDLINSYLTRESAGPELFWLFDSGLYESIRYGSVKAEVGV